MSAYRWPELLCDGEDARGACHSMRRTEEPCTVEDARKQAADEGWHRVGPGYDICPGCWAEGVRGPLILTETARAAHRRTMGDETVGVG